jgi:hypothetical protein
MARPAASGWHHAVVSDYADRLDPETYADDPIVAVYRDDPADSLCVPERVFWRVSHVAKGYELHLLPLLGNSDPVRLNRPMIQTMLDELCFVADRLEDPVVQLWVAELLKTAQNALRRPGDTHLTVEGE